MNLTPGKLAILARWALTRRPTTVAVDVTHRCNLKCAHCYWWQQDHPPELDDQAMKAFLQGLKARGLRAAILYGGEPTLRTKLCREASFIFDSTLAFTNGTQGFPELQNGQWIVSLDGPEEINDRIRGTGVYREAVRNMVRSSQYPIVHTTITPLNRDGLGEFVQEMLSLPIKGIGFSFFTPQKGMAEPDLLIPIEERGSVLRDLLALRKQHGERIGFTRAMARQLLVNGDFCQWNSLSTCPVSQRVRCFKSNGQPKACTYGDEADCSRCGCAAVVAYRGAFRPFDWPTLRVILGLMVPEYRVKGP